MDEEFSFSVGLVIAQTNGTGCLPFRDCAYKYIYIYVRKKITGVSKIYIHLLYV